LGTFYIVISLTWSVPSHSVLPAGKFTASQLRGVNQWQKGYLQCLWFQHCIYQGRVSASRSNRGWPQWPVGSPATNKISL